MGISLIWGGRSPDLISQIVQNLTFHIFISGITQGLFKMAHVLIKECEFDS
jgi:hypothetical protein